ncbi:MAG: methyltransferase domain-containing protein, partial [Butyrivibrio sp.]|nr:methyltransferase domain-containing protein [Butyrivibrio sp.]
VSNNASMQTLKDAPETYEACMAFGKTLSVPCAHPYEERARFTGFAVWIKQRAHLAVCRDSELLDAQFSPGYFEDDDLGMRIALAGYRQLLCHNAFIYHRGGSGFFSREAELNASREKFAEKWGFDVWGYTALLDELLDAVTDAPGTPVRVLQLDAGMGIHLSALKHRYPYGFFAGIEQNPVVCGLGRGTADILCGDAETTAFPWPEHFFDYIFVSDTPDRARDRDAFLAKLNRYLAPGGSLV